MAGRQSMYRLARRVRVEVGMGMRTKTLSTAPIVTKMIRKRNQLAVRREEGHRLVRLFLSVERADSRVKYSLLWSKQRGQTEANLSSAREPFRRL